LSDHADERKDDDYDASQDCDDPNVLHGDASQGSAIQ